MDLLIGFFPLCGAILGLFFSCCVGRRGTAWGATLLIFINVGILLWMFFKNTIRVQTSFANYSIWMNTELLKINWGFSIDNLTLSMLVIVNIIAALVHLYSMNYMKDDLHVSRFMSYLSFFTFFMIILVSGNNFVILFLGWEGVGLCSYLLISFWYTRIQANKAAIKALIVNRIADFALTIGMLIIFFIFKSLDFSIIFSIVPFFENIYIPYLIFELPLIEVVCFLLFIGAMGKSAQIGLHTWLPDAMEGPTPVSALIHAATMVTAGVFLLIKCSPLFEYVSSVLSLITFIGASTAFFSATIGLVQNDIKKVIAYSTCSQLGYMIFACGLSNYNASLFHLANHAFFKALLFLSAGAIIHSLSNEQDMRRFGNLNAILPFTSIMLIIGSISLIGFPFSTGYYSKDLILEISLTKYLINGSLAYTFGLITAFFTAYYSTRLIALTFSNWRTLVKITDNQSLTNGFRRSLEKIHELPIQMASSLILLSIGSIFLGYFAKDLIVGLGTNFWTNTIFILSKNNNQLNAEFLGWTNQTQNDFFIKFVPVILSLIAIAITWDQKYLYFQKCHRKLNNLCFLYIDKVFDSQFVLHSILLKSSKKLYNSFLFDLNKSPVVKNGIYNFLVNKWYFDTIYNRLLNEPILLFSKRVTWKRIDQELLQFFGPTGLTYVLYLVGDSVKKFHLGKVYYYNYFFLIFLVLFILYFIK